MRLLGLIVGRGRSLLAARRLIDPAFLYLVNDDLRPNDKEKFAPGRR